MENCKSDCQRRDTSIDDLLSGKIEMGYLNSSPCRCKLAGVLDNDRLIKIFERSEIYVNHFALMREQ